MKKIILLITCFFSFILPPAATAQAKQKAEKEFVGQLNHVLNISRQLHWAYEGNAMTIDSAFAINKEGVLSVTVRYTNDSSFTRVRMEAPVSKIINIA
jgi:hypothetical protein